MRPSLVVVNGRDAERKLLQADATNWQNLVRVPDHLSPGRGFFRPPGHLPPGRIRDLAWGHSCYHWLAAGILPLWGKYNGLCQ